MPSTLPSPFRETDGDAVVGPDRLDLRPEPIGEARLDPERPRGVDPTAERRQQGQPPVPELVAEPLDHDPLVGRQGAGRFTLVLEVVQQVLGRPVVEVVVFAETIVRCLPALRTALQVALDLADERAERAAQLDRAADGVPLPERQLAGDAWGRRDSDPVVADVLDAPGAGTQDDHIPVHPGSQLVDHLFVELADAPTRRAGLALHEHAEQPPVGDGPAAGHGHDPGVAPTLDGVGDAVPHETRLELGELVGWICASEHAQHAVEDVASERLVRRRRRDGPEQVVAGPSIHDGHGDDLLGEDIERVARDARLLDLTLVHAPRDDRDLEQVAAVLREDDALARGADLVPGSADALETAGDARRRFRPG